MRVIAGAAKGRSLRSVPGSSTRPTSDKVKEAVFSMIGPYFQGGHCLDLFAGTGALGIEALSRGMSKAIFVDMDRKAVEVIRDNVLSMNLAEQAEVYRNEAKRAVKVLAKRDMQFDLIFLDPPYKVRDVEELMQTLYNSQLLKPTCQVVVEHEMDYDCRPSEELYRQIRRAVYGDTVISLYTLQTVDMDKQMYEIIKTNEEIPVGGN